MVAARPLSRQSVWANRLAPVLVSASLSCLPLGVHAALNDTGITEVANAEGHSLRRDTAGYPGQDARHGRDAAALAGRLKKIGGGSKGFDFTKLDARGAPLPASAKEWGCVRDNVTGLIWEAKTADHGLRDWRNHYSWYNPDNAVNGGHPGEKNGGKCAGGIDCDTYAYTQAVNALKLCGYADWRLPDRWELRSLVDYGKTVEYAEQFRLHDNDQAAIDTRYFPHNSAKWYWTAIPSAAHPDYAWRVFFYDGGDSDGLKGSVNGATAPVNVHVRLVRGGQ